MYCYQFNSAAYPTWFLPYVTFRVPMPALNIVVFGMGTNFGWQGYICKYATCGDSQACYYKLLQRNFVVRYQKSAAKTLVVFFHYPVDYLYANLEFLDLFPDNSKRDEGTDTIRIRVGPSIALNTQLLRRQWRPRLQRWLTGLRAGFVCAVGTMTGSVDEVVCVGGNCTASVLGQGLSIHETGHL